MKAHIQFRNRLMYADRKTAAWEQKLIVTFQASRRDIRELAEDVNMVSPQASLHCEAAGASMVNVELVMPDDAGMLDSAIAIIFRAPHGRHPTIRMRRAFAG